MAEYKVELRVTLDVDCLVSAENQADAEDIAYTATRDEIKKLLPSSYIEDIEVWATTT